MGREGWVRGICKLTASCDPRRVYARKMIRCVGPPIPLFTFISELWRVGSARNAVGSHQRHATYTRPHPRVNRDRVASRASDQFASLFVDSISLTRWPLESASYHVVRKDGRMDKPARRLAKSHSPPRLAPHRRPRTRDMRYLRFTLYRRVLRSTIQLYLPPRQRAMPETRACIRFDNSEICRTGLE